MSTVWAVESPCGPDCVQHRARPVSARTALRRHADFTAIVAGTAAHRRTLTDPAALRLRARHLLDALEVRQEGGEGELSAPGPHATGTTRTTGTLIVANHISWLDVIALLAREPVTLVAKREVAGWPVVGTLARRAGTCFIDRDGFRRLHQQVAVVRETLLAGRSVAVFPQATTWCSQDAGTFRRAMFQAALDARAPVRPVTVGYRQHGAPSTVAAFVGDDGFLPSLHRVARADGLSVRVEAHEVLYPDPSWDRRSLARTAQDAVLGMRSRTSTTLPHRAPVPADLTLHA
ncbi:lysophospholipid acyltransferase family protein [Streptomyces indicus]|uniref:1-acyl-sn-glycerol-3-phosphate acyltransferases n=1 Tax=Streptomyces indicus TaxID=417292 RepID=A0A1G9A721_9ACTN|nr:lysophospholipid acyltransferase family protein [Streptomyces indicus]SDK23136.1 1-acyl-sn-glycerol-3-phosphate acyltransferases [Streptomyces indicus]